MKGAALLALLPKGLGKGEAEGPDDDSDSPEDPGQQAARDFFEAGQKGDWSAASEALETHILHCLAVYDRDEPGDEMKR